jgi:CHASE3 domain sensor protein
MEIEKKSNGAFVGLIIVIIILVIGGIYMWQENQKSIQEAKDTQAKIEAISNQEAAALDALIQDTENMDLSAEIDVKDVN